MARIFGIIISIVSLLLCSCCKLQHEQGSLKPEWSAQIPTFESPEIFYPGILNLPKSGDIMVLPTTIYDGGFMWEDNRLCGMDLKTGEVKWYFPSDLDNRRYCHFDSKGYEYRGKLVFQYETNHNEDTRFRSTACLDVKTGSVLWEKDCKTTYFGGIRPAIGSGEDCFIVQDSCKICRVDMRSNQISELYYSGDDSLQISDIKLYDNYIVVSCLSYSVVEEYHNETFVVIIDKTTGNEIFKKYLGRASEGPHSCYLEGNVIYSAVDRTMMAVDVKTGEIIWNRYDMCAYGCQDILFYNDVLMKCAVNATVGYDKKTGEVKYLFDNYGSWYVTQEGRYAYFLNCKNELDILDIETGKKLDYVVCPNKGEGFFGSYPMIYDNKLYIIGSNTLYRYPTYPW